MKEIAEKFDEFLVELNIALDSKNNIFTKKTEQHLLDTPERVTKMYVDFFSVEEPKFTTFEFYDEPQFIFMKDIPLKSLCAHHFLPIIGTATIAYLPRNRVVGLSKLVRITDYFSRRPQIQENLTNEIADYLFEHSGLKPQAVGVHISAEHFCMSFRGVQQPGIQTVTHALRGSLRTDDAQRSEYMQLLKG